MKNKISILLLLFLSSCGHRYLLTKELVEDYNKRTNQKFDTLIVMPQVCSGCGDYQIIQGKINIPADISNNSTLTADKGIKICGNFPVDLADHDGSAAKSEFAYRMIGKVIKADGGNASLPLFYVDHSERFSFKKETWMSKDNHSTYTERLNMINGIIRNILFEGQPIGSIVNLLGEPDQREKNKVRYHIADRAGAGEDPGTTTNLIIIVAEDSTILSKALSTEQKGK